MSSLIMAKGVIKVNGVVCFLCALGHDSWGRICSFKGFGGILNFRMPGEIFG